VAVMEEGYTQASPRGKRGAVEPFTVMMSSLPSLSQSIRPTPPLMDSTMYFLSEDEMCETVRPAFCATSSNCGREWCVSGSSAFSQFTDGELERAAWETR